MLIKMSKFVVLCVGPDDSGLPSGGDVWVLVIKNSKPSDSGIYVCEVNSNPIVRSFHKLSGEYMFLFTRALRLFMIVPCCDFKRAHAAFKLAI